MSSSPPLALRDLSIVTRSGHVDGPLDVCLRDGRIEDVGRHLSISDGATEIDMAGVFALPGVIDCHTHLTLSTLDLSTNLRRSDTTRALEAAHAARRTLHAGVTYARDAGGADAGLRDGIAHGLVPGPGLQVSIVMVSRTGGHADGHLAGLEIELGPDGRVAPRGGPSHLVDSVDDMRRVARQILRAGGDWIKLCATGGIGSDHDDPLAPELSADELRTAVAEAAIRGRRVMVHAYGGEGLDNALEADVASVEHGTLLTERQARRMAEQGTFLVPTMSVLERDARLARAGDVPPHIQAKTLAVEPHLRDVLGVAHAAGVSIALGSDAVDRSLHGRNLTEIAALRRGGLPAHDCLRAATIEGARLLGVDHERGAIEPGMAADLVLLDEDPSDGLLFDRDDVVTGVLQGGRTIVAHARFSCTPAATDQRAS
ncbi:MAG: amidohydrolase [Actinomycetia bacterium]|nr:amidohydrolase [Actinomycetes bacterium]